MTLPTLDDIEHAMVRIEVPRLTFVKRKPCGTVDFVSPLPCPYNYGSIEGTLGADGDPLDALVLGPRIAYGTVVSTRVWAVMGFVDAGEHDPKLVCSDMPLTLAQRRGIERFLRTYAVLKRAVHLSRRRSGITEVIGWLR